MIPALHVQSIKGCQILTVEITTPFGQICDQDTVDTWLVEHLAGFLDRVGERIRWHILGSRNSAEGTRYRVVLVASPLGFAGAKREADMLLPQEFALVGAAEGCADGGMLDFVWVCLYENVLHWLVYREGRAAFWLVETLPELDLQAWLALRVPSLRAFLDADPGYANTDNVVWNSSLGELPGVSTLLRDSPWSSDTVVHANLVQASRCGWGASLNLMTPRELHARRARIERPKIVRVALVSLMVCFVIFAALWFRAERAERSYQILASESGPLLTLQTAQKRIADSLNLVSSHLDVFGVGTQGPLRLKSWMQGLYSCLPMGGNVSQLQLDSRAPDGFLWSLQATLPDWDAADLFVQKLKRLDGVRQVQLSSRKAVDGGRILVRVEVTR